MFAVCNGFLMCDNLAVRVTVFHLINSIVVIVAVSYENQVCREVVAVPNVGVDIDHFTLAGYNAQAGLALIEQGGRGWVRR